MAGTQNRAEGLPAYRVSVIDPGSTPENSLKGLSIVTMQQGAMAWVDPIKQAYRWDAASAETADNDNVVTPTGVTGAGRWIKIGGTADFSGNFSAVAQQIPSGNLAVTIAAPNTPVFVGGGRLNLFNGPWAKGIANADDLQWLGASCMALFSATFLITGGTPGDVVRVAVSTNTAAVTPDQVPSATLDASGAGQIVAALQFGMTQFDIYRWTAENETSSDNFTISGASVAGWHRIGNVLTFVP